MVDIRWRGMEWNDDYSTVRGGKEGKIDFGRLVALQTRKKLRTT